MSRLCFSVDRRARVAVLISGRGSNMLALLDAAADPAYPAEIAVVISDAPDAPGLEAAAARGVETSVLPHGASREPALDRELTDRGVDLIAMAGFMRVLSRPFVTAWSDRVLNVHPSLLPAFRGLNTHARALEAGVRIHGATVHLARPKLDEGPILAQAALAVASSDTAESLAARVLALEHQIYPRALALYAEGSIWVSGDRVWGARAEQTAVLQPVGDDGA